MVTSVTSTTDTSAAAAAMKKSLGMNKDDFMKLFVAQLKYQDPLAPQDASAMLDQLSQLTLVEQSYNTNTALQNLLTSQNNSATMSSVSFIGKDVKANGNAVPFDGTSPASMQFNLSAPVDSAQIDISDSNGNIVRTISATALNQGDSAVSWDGRDNNGNLLSAGAYTFSVKGTTAGGSTVLATTYTAGRIDGVSLVDGTPLLTIGAATISLSDVISVKGV
ncbi:MAG: flagellar hook capping protein [Geobacteraceae bacterium GWC2_55_20]|nr:MAG: flagellar hook capping protein [Geobacteraceae bacterium GWC2_55_20]HBA73094.1 flagellar hook capping protein [Geobacter sp.]HCE68761.1 flagellar hook capping protein [Geobacter sp.]